MLVGSADPGRWDAGAASFFFDFRDLLPKLVAPLFKVGQQLSRHAAAGTGTNEFESARRRFFTQPTKF